MAEEDIYKNKIRYERFKLKIKELGHKTLQMKYYCKHPANIKYYERLCILFEAMDVSYIRRNRLIQEMKFITHFIEKDLKDCTREDINFLMSVVHGVYTTPKSKMSFITDVKHIWKSLFPECDNFGRPDETVIPYAVRHLSAKIDKSREKSRTDKLTADEMERMMEYFSNEPRMQAYIAFAVESLARPQEILGRRIENLEMYQNYAKIHLTEHGKEGIGLLQCIDSYPYLLKWLDVHPLKNDKSAYLFINTGFTNRNRQMRPENVNKMMKLACEALGIKKPITCYSLKRNGVTMRRLRGESDVEIQHAARWTSTKQLKTYDMSNQDEAFNIALKKRGLIEDHTVSKASFETRQCPYCNSMVGFSESICPTCKHIISRKAVFEDLKKDEEIVQLRNEMADIRKQITEGLMRDILAKKGVG